MDYNRLAKVLRWNIIGYKPQLWRFFTQSFVGFAVITLSQCIGNYTVDSIDNAGGINLLFYLLMILLCASNVCFNIRTKTECISYSMLPATKAEKFMANVIYETFLMLIISIAGLVAVDAAQAVIILLAKHSVHSLTWATITHLSGLFTFRNMIGMAALILAHSTYVLGGTFFRRHQFLWTSFSILAFNTMVGILASGIIAAFAWGMHTNGYDVGVEWLLDGDTSDIVLTIIILATAALFYYLAYRSYCRIQVINNRFFN